MHSESNSCSEAETALLPRFSHIYVEDALIGREDTEQIRRHFPKALLIPIHHYKDVFNRRQQNVNLQHRSQKLILAEKHGKLIYPGAPVCQSFGNQHFYYTSCVMNCLYDCEYCYLKGMYPSGNLVLFLNLEDIFAELRELLRQHPVYLCISYDTDLLALEGITGMVQRWAAFVAGEPALTVEIRTKTGSAAFWDALLPYRSPRLIFAFTLSPEAVVTRYEHDTGSLDARLRSIARGLSLGFTLRLCFDPMLAVPDWRGAYGEMLAALHDRLPLSEIRDISIGSFRLSEVYLKAMRRAMPDSAVVQYPYENQGQVYQYPAALAKEMEQFLRDGLPEIPAEKVFTL